MGTDDLLGRLGEGQVANLRPSVNAIDQGILIGVPEFHSSVD